jgi:hypothetical protein
MLHANGPYNSSNPMRAVSRLLCSYLEFVVIFASFYLVVAGLEDDQFGPANSGFLNSRVNPLYLSMITIASVGYGDFSPQTPLGRSVVIIEVFCGLLLLVVVLQRVLTVSLTSQDRDRNDRSLPGRHGHRAILSGDEPVPAG